MRVSKVKRSGSQTWITLRPEGEEYIVIHVNIPIDEVGIGADGKTIHLELE